MNSVNASIGFSNFQIRLGRSPCIIPPIVPGVVTPVVSNDTDALCARELIVQLQTDVVEAKDN